MKPRLDPCAWALAAFVLLAGCTGRLPGTGAPAQSRPGVVYETVRRDPTPVPERAYEPEAEPVYAEPSSPAEAPSYLVPAAPAPAPALASAGPESGGGARDAQLAILTEAVTALRQEISRSYAHSQELMEETKRLRVQLKSMRTELEAARGENKKLRDQVRTLERRLKEIRVTPPVDAQAAQAPAPAAPAAPEPPAAAEPAPEEAPPEDEVPEPPVVDDGAGAPDQDAAADFPENTAPSP